MAILLVLVCIAVRSAAENSGNCFGGAWQATVQLDQQIVSFPSENIVSSSFHLFCVAVSLNTGCPGFTLVLNNSAGESHLVATVAGGQTNLSFTSEKMEQWYFVYTNVGNCVQNVHVIANVSGVPLHCPDRCSGHGYCDIADEQSRCNCIDDAGGHWSGIACETCAVGYCGPLCNKAISCNLDHGICDPNSCSGPHGNGDCSACQKDWWGSDCANAITCNVSAGTCHEGSCDGISGNGHCTACGDRAFGLDCENTITCKNGTCPQNQCFGPSGNGRCTHCNEPWLGPNCDSKTKCSIEHAALCLEEPKGTCYGINATGKCDACMVDYYGPYCAEHVRCNRSSGVCNRGTCYDVGGTGFCDSCFDYNFGKTCVPVPCNRTHGRCERYSCWGINGTGGCTACSDKAYGVTCDTLVTCNLTHGHCNNITCFGVNGTGTCSSCDTYFFGTECQPVTCNINHGACPSLTCDGPQGNGKCQGCTSDWQGDNCDIEKSFWEQHLMEVLSVAGATAVALLLAGGLGFAIARIRRRCLAPEQEPLVAATPAINNFVEFAEPPAKLKTKIFF